MIEPKKKPCKGNFNAKGYGCGKMVLHRTYGLGMSCCYRTWLLNSEQGKAKLKKAQDKASAPRKSLEEATRKTKEIKGIASMLTMTKLIVHKMIRLRDEGKPCISCGCQWTKEFQAGHCYPTRYRSIRFHFHNINGQCQKCNLFLDGNETQYLIQLPLRIGQEDFDELKIMAKNDSKFNKKWTRDELKTIQENAKFIIKNL